MELDMPQVHAFRTHRGVPKRPRSPPSPSPLERPSKRLSLGVNHSVSIPLSQFAVTGLPPPSPMRSRQGSEDWVVQTRGLKIVGDGNSPQPDQSTFTPILERPELREGGIESPHVDGDMTMDSDELMTSPLLAAPPNSPAQMELSTPVSSIIHFNSSVDLSHTLQQTQFSHPTFHTSTPHDIHPPTPQSPADSQEPQDINMHSPRIPPTPTSARRQRFTMGPRADCEKCRMRVKDHWMHFD